MSETDGTMLRPGMVITLEPGVATSFGTVPRRAERARDRRWPRGACRSARRSTSGGSRSRERAARAPTVARAARLLASRRLRRRGAGRATARRSAARRAPRPRTARRRPGVLSRPLRAPRHRAVAGLGRRGRAGLRLPRLALRAAGRCIAHPRAARRTGRSRPGPASSASPARCATGWSGCAWPTIRWSASPSSRSSRTRPSHRLRAAPDLAGERRPGDRELRRRRPLPVAARGHPRHPRPPARARLRDRGGRRGAALLRGSTCPTRCIRRHTGACIGCTGPSPSTSARSATTASGGRADHRLPARAEARPPSTS